MTEESSTPFESPCISNIRNMRRRYRWQALGISSFNRPIILIASALFLFELVIMFLLHLVPVTSDFIIPIIDATLVTSFIFFLYWVVYRPIWVKQLQYATEVSYLSRKLMSLEEEERKRISTDLHDHLGQTLSIMQLKLETLRKGIPAAEQRQMDLARGIIHDIAHLSDELREIIHELRPVMLEDCGLISSIRNLISEFSEQHPFIEICEDLYEIESSLSGPVGNIGIYVFRICQELLNNISKHAEASEVRVCLQQKDNLLSLVVEDNGKGFVVRRIHGGKRKGQLGIGLLGINERVKELGGTFTLQTEPNKGTLAIVDFPLDDSRGGI